MNILQIGTIDNSGGAASISWSIKKELEKEGYIMSMFVRDKNSTDKNVHVIPQKIHRYFHYLLSNDLDLYFTDWILNTKEFKEADIVHVHNIHGWFFNLQTLQKMTSVKPVIWTLHDMWAITPHCAYSFTENPLNGFYDCNSKKIYPRIFWNNTWYLKWRKRNIYKKTNLNIITPSTWLKNKVEDSVLKDKNIKLIYNGIDENIFKESDKSTARKELNLPPNRKVVMFLSEGGSTNPIKGWDYVETVIKMTSEEILFVCIGGEENIQDKIFKNLTYIKRIEDKSLLAKYFSAADVFLFPSLGDNCPLVILEALSCGIPIVTFKTGGIPELVTHKENGYVAEYKDTNDLINGMNYILNLDENAIENIRIKSREKILENFTVSKMVSKYKDIYIEVKDKFKK